MEVRRMREESKTIKAMKQALEALEALEYLDGYNGWVDVSDKITALRVALAETTCQESRQVEPVAWMVYSLDGQSVCVTDNPADFTDQHRALPLYTTPPQREPMTDEALDQMFENAEIAIYIADRVRAEHLEVYSFGVRDAERAHGIGGEK
jgi:hypothetical protein